MARQSIYLSTWAIMVLMLVSKTSAFPSPRSTDLANITERQIGGGGDMHLIVGDLIPPNLDFNAYEAYPPYRPPVPLNRQIPGVVDLAAVFVNQIVDVMQGLIQERRTFHQFTMQPTYIQVGNNPGEGFTYRLRLLVWSWSVTWPLENIPNLVIPMIPVPIHTIGELWSLGIRLGLFQSRGVFLTGPDRNSFLYLDFQVDGGDITNDPRTRYPYVHLDQDPLHRGDDVHDSRDLTTEQLPPDPNHSPDAPGQDL